MLTHDPSSMVAMYVKICGLTRADTAAHTARLGADAVGVVMSEGSPRNALPEQAREVIRAAREVSPSIDTVLIVRHMPAAEAAQRALELGFDVLQLHGPYSREDFLAAGAIHPRIWRATSLAEHPDLIAGEFAEEHVLIDGAVPGSGAHWDLSLIEHAELGPEWILAGGLTPETVGRAVAEVSPWGVDVSSGVESAPGVKSLERIAQFIHAARAA